MEELTTEDLKGDRRFLVVTFYGVEYIIGKGEIVVRYPSDKESRECSHKAEQVKIVLCQVGSWLNATLRRNGVEKPFLSNCITITSIEPA